MTSAPSSTAQASVSGGAAFFATGGAPTSRVVLYADRAEVTRAVELRAAAAGQVAVTLWNVSAGARRERVPLVLVREGPDDGWGVWLTTPLLTSAALGPQPRCPVSSLVQGGVCYSV